jgi:hypothetical protein
MREFLLIPAMLCLALLFPIGSLRPIHDERETIAGRQCDSKALEIR